MEVLTIGGWIVDCPRCHSFLKVENKDVKHAESGMRFFGSARDYVTCITCGNEIEV